MKTPAIHKDVKPPSPASRRSFFSPKKIRIFAFQCLFRIRPKMIYEQIKKQATEAVPFAKLAGVEIKSVDAKHGVATLKERPEILNHVNTIHAAALFALGEATSGITMAGAMASVIVAVKPVVSLASVSYLKPANGEVVATGQLSRSADEVIEELRKNGRVRFGVNVAIANSANDAVCVMEFEWHLKMK
jgi:acyl-coenzyme A thioesterase PaaI-like protein